MLTIEDLRNDARPSGFDHVNPADRHGGPRAQGEAPLENGRRKRWHGPRRESVWEAAQDYCDYVNNLPVIREHQARKGRPDWHKTADGVLHVDLPGKRRSSLRHPSRGANAEREMIQRLTPRMARLLQPGDVAEAKAVTSRQAIVTGVGQLLLRRYELGNAARQAYLVLPSNPHAVIRDWLFDLGIGLITEEA